MKVSSTAFHPKQASIYPNPHFVNGLVIKLNSGQLAILVLAKISQGKIAQKVLCGVIAGYIWRASYRSPQPAAAGFAMTIPPTVS